MFFKYFHNKTESKSVLSTFKKQIDMVQNTNFNFFRFVKLYSVAIFCSFMGVLNINAFDRENFCLLFPEVDICQSYKDHD